ncbi:MAG: sigma-70 family RNA polymerase sigma factor [Coprobacillus sp.]
MMIKREIDEVIEEYSDILLRLALHHIHDYAQAQDIVQDTFIKYIYKAPEFNNQEHEKAWLIRVMSNLCKDYLKHWWQRNRVDSSYEDISFQQEKYELLEVVRTLSFHQRNAVYLYYYEDMSIKDIAKIFQVSENTVSSWLFRARKKLKEILKGEWENDEG